jgi:hypothetical protein
VTQEEIHILRGIAKAVLQQSAQLRAAKTPSSSSDGAKG